MRTFDVYRHASDGHEAVKQGFSWPAFFFTWIWALLKKLWGQGLALIVLIITLTASESLFQQHGEESGTLIMLFIQLAVSVWVGTQGNRWRIDSLGKRGYQHVVTVSAENPAAAVGAARADL